MKMCVNVTRMREFPEQKESSPPASSFRGGDTLFITKNTHTNLPSYSCCEIAFSSLSK